MSVETIGPRDEAAHTWSGEPGWSERLAFAFFDTTSGFAGVTRIESRPGPDGGADATVTLFVPGGGLATVLAREKQAPRDGWAVGRIAADVEEPLRRWRLRCKDTALVFPSAGGATVPASGERRSLAAPVELDLAFDAWMPPHGRVDRETEVDDQRFVRVVSSGAFEQAGAASGALRLGNRSVQLAGGGVRTKAWGARDRTAAHAERWFAVAFGPSLALSVRGVTLGELEMRSGWVFRDGAVRGVAGFRMEAEYEGRALALVRLRVTDDAGDAYAVEGVVESSAPMREGGLRLTQSILRYRSDGHEALGLAELVEAR